MLVINWLAPNLIEKDLQSYFSANEGLFHLRSLCRAFVRSVLLAYPWNQREDVVSLFNPSNVYKISEMVAFPKADPQGLRPDTWRIGAIKSVKDVENPSQGAFQVVTIDLDGQRLELAANLSGSPANIIRFPPEDEESLDWLVSDFTDTYYDFICSVVVSAIRDGRINGKLYGDQVLIGDTSALIGVHEQDYIQEIFSELSLGHPWWTTEEIIDRLRDLGCLKSASGEIASLVIEQYLSEKGFQNLGEKQWTTIELFELLDRKVARRMSVPVIRSRLAQECGEDDLEDLTSYEEAELSNDGLQALAELGEEQVEEKPASTEWLPPSAPVAMPILTYLHILQGFFPLSLSLERTFDPRERLLLVHIQVVEGEALPFLVNRPERVIKALASDEFRARMIDLGIPAGIHLWLDYQGGLHYRIAPRPLMPPKMVECKQVYLEQGSLHFSIAPIEMRFEGDPHLFKAEMRFEDMEALFREAEQSEKSIFDAMYSVFGDLAQLHPEGLVHHSDLFNAVFFQHRMCSPRSVVTELYNRPCFVPEGNGYFSLDMTRGIRLRRTKNKPTSISDTREKDLPPNHEPGGAKSQRQPEPPESGFWEQIISLAHRQLHTLDQHKPFEIIRVTNNSIEMTTSTGEKRTIARWKIEKPWIRLQQNGEITRSEIRHLYTEFNPAYVAAILAVLPGVEFRLRPIKLTYHPPEKAAPLLPTPTAQDQSPERTRKGQLIAPGIIPQGPLFEQPTPKNLPTEPLPPVKVVSEADRYAPQRTHTFRQDRGEMQTKALFSHHFLDFRLHTQPEWNEDPRAVFEQVRKLWAHAKALGENWNEAQTEQEFVKPVLDALGWHYIVQAKSSKKGQITRPDYALFANEQTKNEAYTFQGNDEPFYSRALAIAEAKYWGRSLSIKDASGRCTWKAESNPSHQMVSYLVGTRCPWGILTNGVAWRLYSREVSSTASEFYEVDLGEIFESLPEGAEPIPAQIEQFKRWWLFFRRSAFIPEAQGKSFVQRVHEGSATYAREISDQLKELVFNEVMPEIAAGFVAFRRQELGITEETSDTLGKIYRASLSLLYKLLFLLYAEARALLPMDHPGYRDISLTTLAEWAAERLDQQQQLSDSPGAAGRYAQILALFHRIDHGDPSLGIPRYNGGLFSPANPENKFLETHKLSDRALARAVDLLVRHQGQPVDYAFISVRNLGAIYEGLLENKLAITSQGQVELVNDKGERKATGSYYTPDYIVEYIVQNTLDPVLEARQADYAAAMDHITTLHKKLAKTVDRATNQHLQSELTEIEQQAREAFLGIKVLDPAMGSGHFLVNAVDHLTDGIIQRMQAYHDAHPEALWDWDPIQILIERVRSDILGEIADQGLPLDASRLDDTALLIRLVMKRCIYGVDLNRMAVELAKVSLWLHSFTVGAPLSFLDHHLRWGNSLIGADVRTVEQDLIVQKQETKISAQNKGLARARGEKVRDVDLQFQTSLFGGPFAGLLDLTAVMIEVAERADATLADVHHSAEAFETLQKELTPYKQMLDLWVSQYFGNPRALEFLTTYRDNLLEIIKDPTRVDPLYADAISKARDLWVEKRFFHWDLEFPEVFVDLRRRNWAENPGFDAVIGNPPYIRPHHVVSAIKSVLWELFPQTYQAKSDILNCFIQKGLDVLANASNLGMITSDSWMLLSSSKGLREYILDHASILGIGLLTGKVFEDASVKTKVILLQKDEDSQKRESNLITIMDIELCTIIAQYPQSAYIYADENIFFIINQQIYNLRKKVEIVSVPLGRIVEVDFGLKTGDDEKFLKQQKIGDDYKQLVNSKSIGRYSIDWDGTYVWYVPNIMTEHRATARPGEAKRFEGDKVIVSRMSERLSCIYDAQSFFVKDALLLHTTSKYSLKYLTSLLNSKLLDIYYSSVFTTLDLHRNELVRLPIRQINFTSSVETCTIELSRFKRLYENNRSGKLLSEIAGKLKHIPEQADIVHDLLAYLTDQMIALNRERLEEEKGFLSWLEREISAPLGDLTGKANLQNYLGDYQKGEEAATLEQILTVLRKNRKKLSVDVSGRAFQERLEEEYSSSLGKLLPIKQKLASTDWLIDQIVYALYGLTEEEIAVVEGRA